MVSTPYYYQVGFTLLPDSLKKKDTLAVKTEIHTANRDEAVKKSRDIGIWSSIINIYTENSKHLSKEQHHHYQEGQRKGKGNTRVERKSNQPYNIPSGKVISLEKKLFNTTEN